MSLLNGVFGSDSHERLVLDASPSTHEFYWQLSETDGSRAHDKSGKGRHGTYNGPKLAAELTPFGNPAPLFDGVFDFVDVFSDSLASALSTWSDGTIAALLRVPETVWTDGIARNALQIGDSAQSNRVSLTKYTVSNQVRATRNQGGSSVNVFAALPSPTDWFYFCQSWSVANNRFRSWIAYRGVPVVQLGSTQTGLIAWLSVALNVNRCLIGGAHVITPANQFEGLISEVSGWSSEFAQPQFAAFTGF